MLRYFICLSIVMHMPCSSNQNKNALNEVVDSMGAEFPIIVSNSEKYRLQILYTQVDRNQKNEPSFIDFTASKLAEIKGIENLNSSTLRLIILIIFFLIKI